MKKSLCVIAMTGLFVLPLSLTSCASVEPAAPSVVPMPVGADRVNPKWLHFNCAMSDINFEQVKLCIQTQAALLPPLDKNKREYFGESYDPVKYLKCRMEDLEKSYVSNTACDRFRLRRVENPEYWPNPDVPKPKWPDAPNPPVYREGMTSEEYFKALCEKEAGEFIYKTVENVEGIYQIRPKNYINDSGTSSDVYVNDAPYVGSMGLGGYKDTIEFSFVRPGRYSFFENSITHHRQQYPVGKKTSQSNRDDSYFNNTSLGETIALYTGFDGNDYTSMRVKYSSHLQSRYGFTWREIKRDHDRDLEIAGSEFAVIDLQTGEVLAIKRGFARREQLSNAPRGIRIWAQLCPRPSQKHHILSFIEQVLKPVQR